MVLTPQCLTISVVSVVLIAHLHQAAVKISLIEYEWKWKLWLFAVPKNKVYKDHICIVSGDENFEVYITIVSSNGNFNLDLENDLEQSLFPSILFAFIALPSSFLFFSSPFPHINSYKFKTIPLFELHVVELERRSMIFFCYLPGFDLYVNRSTIYWQMNRVGKLQCQALCILWGVD